MKRVALSVAAFLGLAAIAEAQPNEWKASSWRKADALFHSDKRWLGADAAFSVPLDVDRILWLFGDTFVGDGKVKRAKSTMVRNSVGLMYGRDPSRATISFHWRTVGNQPASYFPEDGATWFWPLHGIAHGGSLTLFFMRVEPTTEGLGFKLNGTAALRCDDVNADPGAWRFRRLILGDAPAGLALLYGVAVLEDGGHVLAYCADVAGDHDAYLARWPVEEFDRGDLESPEWWNGSAFVSQRELTGPPAVAITPAATEFSVHRLEDGRYAQVQSTGFGATDIGMRIAPRPEGPWPGQIENVYTPPDSRKKGAFVYAGKAHPELVGAELIVTYAANHFDPNKLLRSRTLYYPRFVRLERLRR